MNRQIVYPGSIPLDTDILNTERNIMVALGFLAKAALGNVTCFDGLACTQQTVPNMSVTVAPGSALFLTTVDATSFGSLPADTADALVKVGVNLTATTLNVTAPLTSGQSVNYLIEAAFQESDGTSVVLPYYNSSNPAVPYSGPANAGTPQNTQRLQTVSLQAKAGTPATTGTQTTPAADSGYTGLYVVTVAYAATSVVNANISTLSTAPFIDGPLTGRGVQPGRLLNESIITATGTYTPTQGMNTVIFDACGGGGAGGGCPATSSGQFAAGPPGTAATFARVKMTAAQVGSGLAITIGAGGVAVSGATGGNGGSTLIGSGVTIPGGVGGVATGVLGSEPITFQNGASSTVATVSTGTALLNEVGTATGVSQIVSASQGGGGAGGATCFGPGAPGVSVATNGAGAVNYGAGGGGTASIASGSALIGGNGYHGAVYVREYS